MPSVITLDNEEAQIKVAQEVPFITGQFTTTAGGGTTQGNPFTTIQRQEVGTILKITPQITEEDTILLKIEQEASGIAAAAQQVASDIVTNKRTISTRVLVDDGGMIVLGGLIEDRLTESESKVPFLGSIPLLGELFRTRSTQMTKTNLMVFIRPRVLRTPEQASFETNAKYRYMRDLQLGRNDGKVSLMPGVAQPTIPEIAEGAPTLPGPRHARHPGPAGREPATGNPGGGE
jgi:general secretion pathway protein D